MNILSMNTQRKLIFFASILGVISIFLPWITISIMGEGMSQNGFRGAGIVVFLAFAAAGLISIMGDQKTKLDRKIWLAALASGIIAFLFTIISFGSTADGDAFGLVDSGYGIGIWLALICSLVVVGAAWLYKNPTDNIKDGLNEFMGKK